MEWGEKECCCACIYRRHATALPLHCTGRLLSTALQLQSPQPVRSVSVCAMISVDTQPPSSSPRMSTHPASDASLPLPPCRHIRINLGDPAIVKHTLDEQAAMVSGAATGMEARAMGMLIECMHMRAGVWTLSALHAPVQKDKRIVSDSPPCCVRCPSVRRSLLCSQYVLDQGYVEDVRLSNLKLGMGAAAVLLTIVTQFWPVSFPESANFVKSCVLVYFVLQGVLQLVHLLVEKDCILLTKRRTENEAGADAAVTSSSSAKGKKSASAKKKAVAAPADDADSSSSSSSSSTIAPLSLPPYAVSLSASLERYSTDYSLTLATRTSESLSASLRGSSAATNLGTVSAAGVPQVSVSTVLQITDFFDANGVFLMERYQSSMRDLLQAFTNEVERVKRSPNSRAGAASKKAL